MTRAMWIAALALVAMAATFYQVAEAPLPPLAPALPSGALLVIESKRFSSLLAAWNGSSEKAKWLKSANHDAFEYSNLASKLGTVFKEYEEAAGFSPGMDAIESLAGQDAALALYDIRNVEFVYITRLATAKAAESALWRVRDRFAPRQSAGLTFYVRNNANGGRAVAFAVVKDRLLLATREDLLARSLALLAGGGGAGVTSDDWYQAAAKAAGSPGDVRLTMNLELLRQSVAFRSYWIQRNISELKPYWAGVVDLFHEPNEIRESRFFLRREAVAPPSSEERKALAEAWALAPETSGFAHGWSAPSSQAVIAVLRDKALDPATSVRNFQYAAPAFQETPDAPGSASDLEKRIDEPLMPEVRSGFDAAPLLSLFAGNSPEAMVVTQGTATGAQDSFFRAPAVVCIAGRNGWNPAAVQDAISAAVGSRWTIARLGVGWRGGPGGSYELDGPGALAVAVRGKLLLVATDRAALQVVLQQAQGRASTGNATSRSRFRHDIEGSRFREWMKALDTPAAGADGQLEFSTEHIQPVFSTNQGVPLSGQSTGMLVVGQPHFFSVGMFAGRQQPFFSANLGSLSEVFSRVLVEEIESESNPSLLTETVRYKMGP